MFPGFFDLSWISIAVATLVLSVVGGLWFTVLFGKAYQAALGRPGQPQGKLAPLFIVGPMFCSLVSTVAMAFLAKALHIESLGDSLIFGAVVGFGLLAATTVNTAINPNMPRPLFYGLISGGYFFVSGIIASVILVMLR